MAVVGGANPILGVLGGAIVSLTWLYLLALSTLIGAELNATLAGRRAGITFAPVAVPAAANGSGPAAPPTPGPASSPSPSAPVEAASRAVGAAIVAAAVLLGRRHHR